MPMVRGRSCAEIVQAVARRAKGRRVWSLRATVKIGRYIQVCSGVRLGRGGRVRAPIFVVKLFFTTGFGTSIRASAQTYMAVG
jgi:hypothetical protein